MSRQRLINTENRLAKRLSLLRILFLLGFSALLLRAIYVHGYSDYSIHLEDLAANQYHIRQHLASARGHILDRRGYPLALSTESLSVAINPKMFSATRENLHILSGLLDIKQSAIKKIAQRQNSYFAWLKRRLPMNQITKLEEANIRGLRLIPEASRHYPNGRLAAHVLGFVGIDNKGLLGLESSFDAVLSGEKASVVLAKDARGKNLYSTGATPSVPGQSLRLTIDQVIQGYATTALAKGMKDSGSKRGFVIVSDPHTGKILAMVSFPDFDPNSASLSDLETTRNLATNWQFEPGSVIKPLVLALALEQKAVFRQSEYDCEKSGKFEVSPRVFIHDTHPNPLLTPSGILEQSSNICTFKFAQLIGKQGLFDGYANFGLNASFSLPLPGYNRSELPAYNSWSPIKFANISFGQGMLSTGIEMAQAFNTLINGGLLMQPLLVESIQGYDGGIIRQEDPEVLRRVISDETSNIMRELLQASVERGTGKRARVKGQTIGGKTGTTEKIDPQTKSYSSEMRIASFIGFAPVVDPHFSIYVVLDEPSIRPYYGGVWAAPVFAEIAEKTMLYLNVPSLTTWPAPGA